MNIRIEKPTTIHSEAISAICSEGWRQTVAEVLSEEYQKQNIEFWYNRERVKKDIEAGAYSYIALIQSKVVGVIGGGKTYINTGEIYVFYVDDKVRYKGIGKKLLEALTHDQISEGVTEQWVSVQEDNHRGIPFYEARGFVFQEKKIEETDTGERQVSLRFSRILNK